MTKLLKTSEVAERLRVKVDYFRKNIKVLGDFPKPIKYKARAHPKWDENDIEQYIAQKRN